MTGWKMLLHKEVMRFWSVIGQTVCGPVLSAMLYLLIFGQAMQLHIKVYGQIGYTTFLVPGLAMMSLLQNAFSNSSSSLITSKITGNLVFVLLAPLSCWDWFLAYVGASVLRGLVVAGGVLLVAVLFVDVGFVAPLWIIVFAVLAAILMGALGLVAGMHSEKFEQLALFQGFIVMPMTFLSGVFYSIHSLPPFWYQVSHFSPFFYMIDGFRYGFFGVSDVSPWLSLGIVAASTALCSLLALYLLRIGYRLRN